MTLQDFISTVRARLEKATPGPWKELRWRDDCHIIPVTDSTGWMKDCPQAYIAKTGGWGFGYPTENGALIANAPTDLNLAIQIIEIQAEALKDAELLSSNGINGLARGFNEAADMDFRRSQDIVRSAQAAVAEILK